ncbi:MAG: hypothetical protein KA419_12410 [Acidobacteria bacterium]|nr:hypothetical protein [Acidobacteriota bacterium]
MEVIKPPDPPEPNVQTPAEPELDPAKLEFHLRRLRDEQSLLRGFLGGAVAALVGAAIWAGVTFGTGYQIGWMAVGVGFLVGFAIRLTGKGIDPKFGVMGAVLSLAGCLIGNYLTVCAVLAKELHTPFFDLLTSVDFNFVLLVMKETFSPIDLVFYALAVFEGYRFSIRGLTDEEKAKLGKGV